jgi:hypothetical protein
MAELQAGLYRAGSWTSFLFGVGAAERRRLSSKATFRIFYVDNSRRLGDLGKGSGGAAISADYRRAASADFPQGAAVVAGDVVQRA